MVFRFNRKNISIVGGGLIGVILVFSLLSNVVLAGDANSVNSSPSGIKVQYNDLPALLKEKSRGGTQWYINSNGTYTAKTPTGANFTGTNVSYDTVTYDQEGNVVGEQQKEFKDLATGAVSVDKGVINGVGAAIVVVLAWIMWGFVYVLGHLLTFIIFVFIEVIQFNNFINVPTVVTGWVIVRDLCNMFFVLILLFIAFGTILRIPNYEMKQTLPKLILMAILINFSRTIFGLVIDFSQVVMLTFVSSFAQLGSNDFVDLFSMKDFFNFGEGIKNTQSIGVLATLGAVIAGGVALLITTVVMLVLVAVVVMRIILLWIYVILSPLVFFGRAFPGAQQYTEQIWGDFIKQVISGPLLAFFVWLALATTQSTALESKLLTGSGRVDKGSNQFVSGLDDLEGNKKAVGGLAGIFEAGPFQQYIIMIGLLMGGLMVTQQVGGAAGSMAGKGLNAIQKGKGFAGGAMGMTWGGLKMGTDWLNRKQAGGFDIAGKKFGGTGLDFNLARQADRIKTAFADRKARDLTKVQDAASRNLQRGGVIGGALGITADGWAEQYFGLRGLKKSLAPTLNSVFTGRVGTGLKTLVQGSAPYTDSQQEKAEIARLRLMGAKESEKKYQEQSQKIQGDLMAAKAERRTKDMESIQLQQNALEEGWKKNLNNTATNSAKKVRVDALDTSIADTRKEMEEAKKRGDASEYSRLKDNVLPALVRDRAEETKELDAFTKEQQKKLATAERTIRQYSIKDLEGNKNMRSAINAAGKNIESENEDELISQFQGALEENNMPLAAALAKQIVKVGGGNALLSKMGYNVRGGLTKERRAQLESEGRYDEIEKLKGFNDFMRDIFSSQLKMSDAAMLALQTDLSESAKNIYHNYATATTGTDAYGRLKQVDERGQRVGILTEANKMDAETLARRQNRLAYGRENNETGEFEWHDHGLVAMAQRAAIILKEIDGKRFNPSAARAMAEDGALKTLREYLQQVERETGMKFKGKDMNGNAKDLTADEYADVIQAYGKAVRTDTTEALENISDKYVI